MQFRNTQETYGLVAKLLHWSIAVLVLIMLAGGFFLDDLGSEWQASVVNLHKLLGILILFLMGIRIIWRLCNPQPVLPASIPRWQGFLAHCIHGLLYVFLLLMPMAGWMMAVSAGHPPHLGVWVLNLSFIPQSSALSNLGWQLHSSIAVILIVVISLHILAALKHALINRDGVFSRMWFGRG